MTNLLNVQKNGSLSFLPFRPEHFRPDVHAATYKCVAFNEHGKIVSIPVHVRAGNCVPLILVRMNPVGIFENSWLFSDILRNLVIQEEFGGGWENLYSQPFFDIVIPSTEGPFTDYKRFSSILSLTVSDSPMLFEDPRGFVGIPSKRTMNHDCVV